jgi:hypothetical protein
VDPLFSLVPLNSREVGSSETDRHFAESLGLGWGQRRGDGDCCDLLPFRFWTASLRRYSIWPLTPRKSSCAQASSSAQSVGSIRRKKISFHHPCRSVVQRAGLDHGDGLREGFPQQMGQKQEHPGLCRGVLRIARIRNDYLSESGSERFFGDFWFKYATIFCAAGGTATAPLKTMDSASTFLP